MKKKYFGLFFSRFIYHDKHRWSTYKGTQGILTSRVYAIGSIVWDLGSREGTFQKKAIFAVTNDFSPFFLVLSSVT